MPDGSATLTLTLHQKIADVPAAEWDACAGNGNPCRLHDSADREKFDGSAAQFSIGSGPDYVILSRQWHEYS